MQRTLLVREHEQHGIAQLILRKHAVELLLGCESSTIEVSIARQQCLRCLSRTAVLVVLAVVNAIFVVAVDNEDDACRRDKSRTKAQ